MAYEHSARHEPVSRSGSEEVKVIGHQAPWALAQLQQGDPAPLLSEQSLLVLAAMLMAVIAIATICGTIVVVKSPGSLQDFTSPRRLHLITVLVIVVATSIMGIERVLTGEAVASLLGGIVGYVLGSLKSGDEPTGPGQRDER